MDAVFYHGRPGFIAPYMGGDDAGVLGSSGDPSPSKWLERGLIDPVYGDTSLKKGLNKGLLSQWDQNPHDVTGSVAGAQAGIAVQVGVLSGLFLLLMNQIGGGAADTPSQQLFMAGFMAGTGGEVLRELIADWQNGYLQSAFGKA